MQLDMAARHTAATGRGEDTARHTGVTSISRPAREDDRPECERPAAGPPESEQLFRTAFERAVIGIAHVSPEGRWLRFNQRLCDLLGYSHEELAALTFQDVTHPDDLEPCRASFQRLLAGEIDEYAMDKRYIRKDGVPVWTHVAVSLVRTPEGAPDFTVTMIQDITERKRLEQERAHLLEQERAARAAAEAALARAQASEAQEAERAEQLRTILETMTDGVAVTDPDGRYIQTNRAYRELLAADRLPGFDATLPAERGRLLDVRDPATGAPLPRERIPTARALRGEVVTGLSADIRVRALDGRELEVNSSAAPLRDGDGRVVGAVSVLRDVTCRKRLEREREAARAEAEAQAGQLDRIFEAAADGLLVWDAEGRIVRTNAAARHILGLDAAPPGFYQLPLRERVALYAARDEQDPPTPLKDWPFARAMSVEVGTGPGADIRLRALDGRELEVNGSAAPLRDREGHLVGAVCVMHDMTERRRLEREREAARADELATREVNRRMEQFLATAAHDLRTPLTATLGYVDLAQRQFQRLASAARGESPNLARQVEAVRNRLDDAGRGAERLARLVEVLFDTAAMRAGRLELRRAPCDLAALVREQVAEQRVAAPHRAIRLHTPAHGGSVSVEADSDRLGQVVANFLTNALKYAPPERPVEVSVEAPTALDGGWARVAVRDRGPGLPEAERARVWEPFHRAPGIAAQGGNQSGVQGGSLGLGLHICKAIVEAHGGRIGVESAVGRGSTFWFTLSLAHAAAA